MLTCLAIDFGTTNSVLAKWNEQQQTAELIYLPGICQETEPPLVPSLVYVQDGQSGKILFGQPVKKILNKAPQDERIFRDFKRGLLTADEATARDIDNVRWNHANAGKHFIHALIENLPIPQNEIDELVLTVPVTAFSHYLSWLTDTFSELQVEKVRVVDESSAAALGYAVTEPGALVLVFDFGGGSLDLSLVKLPENRARIGGFLGRIFGVGAGQHAARVIAKSGQVLGGGDVDRWLMAEVLHQLGWDPDESAKPNIQLLTACEQAKIRLSSEISADILVPNGRDARMVTITRSELEKLLHHHQFPERLQQAIQSILNTARRDGVFREDIENVLLVGGMSQMPLVQETLAAYFPNQMLLCDKPFTAVAEGALRVAAGLGLEDYLAHSYGLRYFDIQNGKTTYEEILPAGTRYPSENPVEILLAPAHEGQQTLELVIGEIDTEAVSAVDVHHENGEIVFVAQLENPVQAVRPINLANASENQISLNPNFEPGEEHLKAAFRLDENRRLWVDIVNPKTGQFYLQNTLLADLEMEEASEIDAETNGHEPTIVTESYQRGGVRLSIRQLANLLSANALPPEAYSIEAAAVMLHHKDLYVRFEAARMLGRRGDRSARLILEEAIKQSKAPTRASAIRHVYGLTWFSAEPLLQAALDDFEWRVRESAIFALCEFRDPRAYQLATAALQNETVDEVFAAAAWGLRNSFDPEAVPALKASLHATNVEIRERALESLGTNGSPEAARVIHEVLAEDHIPEIKYAAALSLLEIEGDRCLPELVDYIKTGDSQAQLALLRAIFHASNYLGIHLGHSPFCDDLLGVLTTALDEDNPELRLAAIWPLAWMRHPKADALLLLAYQKETNQIRRTEIRHIAVSLGSAIAKSLIEENGS